MRRTLASIVDPFALPPLRAVLLAGPAAFFGGGDVTPFAEGELSMAKCGTYSLE